MSSEVETDRSHETQYGSDDNETGNNTIPEKHVAVLKNKESSQIAAIMIQMVSRLGCFL